MLRGLKAIEKKNIPNDIISGIIIALVSIPISMGYAQIAGLPAVYGLYGSVLPVILFALFSSSPQYIFGVDAAPAAVVGGIIASMGISAGSEEAIKTVPLITLFTTVWLFIFFILKAGRLTEYVSTPVMGGFISGICATIILMQIPKLFGGSSGTGEIHQLIIHITEQASENFNTASLCLGAGSIAVILLAKKYIPKFPMSVAVMLAAAVIQYITDFSGKLGINTLPAVERGLGAIAIPDFSAMSIIKGMGASLTVAVIIMAETLLAENSFAMKNGYKINDNNEVLTFGICNLAASLIGCCPVNGSVSRTSMNEQFSGKSQLTSLVAAGSMIVILLLCTGFIQYLPVPVLTAIVICALLGAIEFDLAKKLRKINKKEFWIFIAAFLGVLVFGTIYGVVIGVILSFVNVIIRESDPPRSYLGVIQGRGGFYSLENNPNARTIKGAVIYRFNANLFFANVKEFREDIEKSITADTKCIIVDAGGLTSIDTTGANTLEGIYKSLKEQNIHFYLTEHIRGVNNQLRQLGLGYIIEEGGVRRTISAALRAEGYIKPYPLELRENDEENYTPNFKEQLLHEFEWAFGEEAQNKIDDYTQDILDNAGKANLDKESLLSLTNLWNGLGSFDEDLLLEALELRLSELAKSTGVNEEELAHRIEERREKIYQYVKSEDEEVFTQMRTRRHNVMHRLHERSPELYDTLHKYHEEIVEARKAREKRKKDDNQS
ncbi:MAG: SulP family inorganic anion transporter [Eubacterium sp.]